MAATATLRRRRATTGTARATAQAGNWSNPATWVGGVVPLPADTVTTNHAVTLDVDASIAGIVFNAAFTYAARLTVAGDVAQGDVAVTFNAGSRHTFDATAADRKWIQGTASGQTSCYILASGTSGNHVTIDRTGSNACWFDGYADGTSNDCTGWNVNYVDFNDIGKADGSFAIGRDSFGAKGYEFRHCVFTRCATILVQRPYGWAGTTASFVVDDCRFVSSISGSVNLAASLGGAGGTGTRSVSRNSFDETPTIGTTGGVGDVGPACDGCYFDNHVYLGSVPSFTNFVVRMTGGNSGQVLTPYSGLQTGYILGDDTIGNFHFVQSEVAGQTFQDLIYDYPHPAGIDNGDCLFGVMGSATVQRILSLPSYSDGAPTGCIMNPSPTGSGWDVTLEHCTTVGRHCQLVILESLQTEEILAFVRSNLIVGQNAGSGGTSDRAFFMDDVNNSYALTDSVAPANVTHNYAFNPEPFNDPVTGLSQPGWHCRMSAPPPTPSNIYDTTTGPGFVDSARSLATWAVFKGAVGSGATLRQKLDAARGLLAATPSLGASDLIPWVFAGFAPTNAALATSAHDGGTIGAVPFVPLFSPAWSTSMSTSVVGSGVY